MVSAARARQKFACLPSSAAVLDDDDDKLGLDKVTPLEKSPIRGRGDRRHGANVGEKNHQSLRVLGDQLPIPPDRRPLAGAAQFSRVPLRPGPKEALAPGASSPNLKTLHFKIFLSSFY